MLLDRRQKRSGESATEQPLAEPTGDRVSELSPTEQLPAQPFPPADDAVTRFDGRRRRRQAALVVGAAMLTGAAGVAIGAQLRSPADEAAARSAPDASRITVPVARQRLESSLVLSGEIQYSEPYIVGISGMVGVPADEAQVVTRVPDQGTTIAEGDAPFEVSGRPIVFLQGALPMYRRLEIGTNGDDVMQLESALDRLALPTGDVDGEFDQATADAVTAMYERIGSAPESASPDQIESLRLARDTLVAAEQSQRDAAAALTEGSAGRPASEMLALRQSLDAAKAAVPIAQQSASNANVAADQSIAASTAARSDAAASADAAARTLASARVAGAIDPSTGEAYTSERIGELDADVRQRQQEFSAADAALINANNEKPVVVANGAASVKSATDAVALAQAQLDEASRPVDITAFQQAATATESVVEQARLDVLAAEAAAGPRLSPGEIQFVPVVPSTVTQVFVSLGSAATEMLATISTADTSLRASVSRADADLLRPGSVVDIEIRDVGVTVPGTVASVGAPAIESSAGGDGEAGQPVSDSSGRLEAVVIPDDPTALLDYIGYSAKLRIAVASTDSDVLVVPVAALTVGPDGASRVEIERTPVTADDAGTTDIVLVDVGLSAGGLVEVHPREGQTLDAGDRVVIGATAGESTDDVAD